MGNGTRDRIIAKVFQDYNQFNSTVLMIAPFPSSKPGKISMSQKPLNVVGLTFSAMMSQMRSKPLHLVQAMDSNCAGQYLVAPSRRVPKAAGGDENIQGEKAIACGALDGFSGFLNKEFRVHDYFLGRYNCQVFLLDYFTIPGSAQYAEPNTHMDLGQARPETSFVKCHFRKNKKRIGYLRID